MLGPYERVAVIDRNLSFGSGGIFAREIAAALASLERPPRLYPFVAGLGGRDITVQTIADVVARAMGEAPPQEILWAGLKD